MLSLRVIRRRLQGLYVKYVSEMPAFTRSLCKVCE